MIDPGTYEGKVVHVEFGQAPNGTKQLSIQFEISEGRKIWWRGWLTEAAEEITMNALLAIGWSPNIVPFEDVDNPVLSWKNASLVIDIEEYPEGSGKRRPKVQWVNDIEGGGSGSKPMDDADKIRIGKRMDALYARLAPKGHQGAVTKGEAPAAAAEPGPDYLEVDDTPF